MRRTVLVFVLVGGPLGAQKESSTRGRRMDIGQWFSFSLAMGTAPMRVEGRSATVYLPAADKGGEMQQWAMTFKPAPAPVEGSASGRLVHRASGVGLDFEIMGGHDWSAWRYGVSLERGRRLGASPFSLTGALGYGVLEERTVAARAVMAGDGDLVTSTGRRYHSDSTYTAVGRAQALEGTAGVRWAPTPGGYWFAQTGLRWAGTVTGWSMDSRVKNNTSQLAAASWSDDGPRVRFGGTIVRVGFGVLIGRS